MNKVNPLLKPTIRNRNKSKTGVKPNNKKTAFQSKAKCPLCDRCVGYKMNKFEQLRPGGLPCGLGIGVPK